ncbi:hypothetical protein CMI37_29795 [Candidatus Pacearchaeota archaeon]|nr:hypothetical protein [Candidatus Pacearchaeota archaeon]
MSAFLFVKKDTIFQSKVVLAYPDSCEEVYINGELTSPICELGRAMSIEAESKKNEWFDSDFNFTIEDE